MGKKLTGTQEGKRTVIGGARTDELKELIKSLQEVSASDIYIEEIMIDKPFNMLRPFSEKECYTIIQNMKTEGFDLLQPVLLWRQHGQYLLLKGHKRVFCAKTAGLNKVKAIITQRFEDEEAALAYVKYSFI